MFIWSFGAPLKGIITNVMVYSSYSTAWVSDTSNRASNYVGNSLGLCTGGLHGFWKRIAPQSMPLTTETMIL